MIGNEIEKRNQFREQSVPIISQIEGQEIETAHKSGRVPMSSIRLIISMNYYRKPKTGSDPNVRKEPPILDDLSDDHRLALH